MTGHETRLKTGAKATFIPDFLWQAGYFWTKLMKQYFVDYTLHPLNEYSFHIQPWSSLSGTEFQNLNGIHNEMPGYFRAKRLYLKKLSNWKSLP